MAGQIKFVKLRDKGSIFRDESSKYAVTGTNIQAVVYTKAIANAIRHGVLVECTQAAYEAQESAKTKKTVKEPKKELKEPEKDPKEPETPVDDPDKDPATGNAGSKNSDIDDAGKGSEEQDDSQETEEDIAAKKAAAKAAAIKKLKEDRLK